MAQNYQTISFQKRGLVDWLTLKRSGLLHEGFRYHQFVDRGAFGPMAAIEQLDCLRGLLGRLAWRRGRRVIRAVRLHANSVG